jgi:hypothetical protein
MLPIVIARTPSDGEHRAVVEAENDHGDDDPRRCR